MTVVKQKGHVHLASVQNIVVARLVELGGRLQRKRIRSTCRLGQAEGTKLLAGGKRGVNNDARHVCRWKTNRVGRETGQESCLDIIVSEQPEGGVDQRVVYVTHDGNRGIDLCEFCTG
jgi:hypothetical protein